VPRRIIANLSRHAIRGASTSAGIVMPSFTRPPSGGAAAKDSYRIHCLSAAASIESITLVDSSALAAHQRRRSRIQPARIFLSHLADAIGGAKVALIRGG
jgi:hypothetical protein